MFATGNPFWAVLGGVSAPLFHAGSLLHQSHAAKAALEAAQAQYRSSALQAFADVSNALTAVKTDGDALAAADRGNRASATSLDFTRRQYELGRWAPSHCCRFWPRGPRRAAHGFRRGPQGWSTRSRFIRRWAADRASKNNRGRSIGAPLLFGRTKSLSPETKPAYAAGHEQGENNGFWRDEALSTLRLAVPLAAANLLQMAVYAIDVIFVARLGQTPLAASSLSVSLFGLLAWSLSGLTGAVSALVAAELGARDHAVRSVRRSTRMGLWLAVGTGILAMILCSFGREIMLMTGQAPDVAHVGQFLHVLKWAMVPMLIGNVLRSVVSALGRPVFATFITALAIAVNAAGNYALVFGHWGMPALGLQGRRCPASSPDA
jgi:hypothetical protein